jgi:hypothetical protein
MTSDILYSSGSTLPSRFSPDQWEQPTYDVESRYNESLFEEVARCPGYLIRESAPVMWKAISKLDLSEVEKRSRLSMLLSWLCKQNGFAHQTPRAHRPRGDGKAQPEDLFSFITHGKKSVAIELCFRVDGDALNRLCAAHMRGCRAILLWAGPVGYRADLLAQVAELTRTKTTTWLDLAVMTVPLEPLSKRLSRPVLNSENRGPSSDTRLQEVAEPVPNEGLSSAVEECAQPPLARPPQNTHPARRRQGWGLPRLAGA